MNTISLSAAILRFSMYASSDEGTRYYLNGVMLEHTTSGIIAVATNGYMLLAARDPDGTSDTPFGSIILAHRSSREFVRVLKMKSAETVEIKISDESPMETVCRILDRDGILIWKGFVSLIDGTFLEWRKVIPKRCVGNENVPSFNPLYLARLEKVAKSNLMLEPVRIVGSGEDSPCLIQFGGQREFFGVLMPMRGSENGAATPPSWSACVDAKAEAAA